MVSTKFARLAVVSLIFWTLQPAFAQESPAKGQISKPLPQTPTLTLRGTVITPSEVLVDGLVTVKGTRIFEVLPSSSASSKTNIVETDSLIFPGLIDLHDHITWNFLPRWQPKKLFSNRYEWAKSDGYRIALFAPHEQVVHAQGLSCDAETYGEVKAIVGGAIAIVGGASECSLGLARNLDGDPGFGHSYVKTLDYWIFPFDPKYSLQKEVKNLDSRVLKAFLVHVAEGSDKRSADEFQTPGKPLSPNFTSAGLLHRGVSIIHGIPLGINDFQKMAQAGVGLIWSPRSNIELYGVTADVRSAKKAGVRIALAPDWSPTGSDGMLQELRFAATWSASPWPDNSEKLPVFSDKELVEMVTVVPAQLAGVDKEIGSVTTGHYADLLLIRKAGSERYREPKTKVVLSARFVYNTLVHASPGDVRLVIINGVPIYGDSDLMNQVLPGHQFETITVCGQQKALYFAPQKNEIHTQKSFAQISQELDSRLSHWGTSLGPLTTCEATNLH